MSGTATKSYLMQRVTGAVMIPISIWILFCLLPKLGIVMFNYSADQEGIIHKLFIGIDSITCMVIFAVCGLYHGILGMQSVIHDYIHCGVMKKIATITIYGLAIFSMIFLTIFCIDMHVKAVQYNQINKSVGNE
jgi:succinate dehydrogenase hydrophobic membrane anchor protein